MGQQNGIGCEQAENRGRIAGEPGGSVRIIHGPQTAQVSGTVEGWVTRSTGDAGRHHEHPGMLSHSRLRIGRLSSLLLRLTPRSSCSRAGSLAGTRARCIAALMLLGAPVLHAQDTSPSAGPRVTDLAGDRNRPGLFTQRLLLPANFCGPLHTHNQDLHGLVLRGILRMGFADSTGRVSIREYPAGSFVPVPAGKAHVEGSTVETEIHLSGIGPLVTTVVDSTRQRCAATPSQGDR